MKKILLLLTLTFIVSQQLQSQSLFDIGSAVIGSAKSKKAQKKIDRENFVIDSSRNVIVNREKREIFVIDSINKVTFENQRNEKIRLDSLAEQNRNGWLFEIDEKVKENQYTINQLTVKGLIANVYDKENRNFDSESKRLNAISVEVFSDPTTTTKISTIKISQIPPNELFLVIAYKNFKSQEMLKSLKNNKIYLISEYASNFQYRDDNSVSTIKKQYTNPLALAQEKLAVANYKTKQKLAISTMDKMIAIQNKHIFKERNIFGQVIKEYYDPSKFTKLEKITYNQLLAKLKSQHEILKKEKDQKIGRRTVYDLLGDLPVSDTSFGDMQAIADACLNFII